MAVYQMIPRWMPYSTPIYIDPLKNVFERIRAKPAEPELAAAMEG